MRVYKKGMTLIEIVITASIIGLLAAFLIPAVVMGIQRRENGLCASKMRIAINAFELYRAETGGYPPDKTPGVVPPEMVDYFDDLGIDWWTSDTEVGGKWDWDNGYHFAYSVSIASPTAPAEQLEELDALLDDGHLLNGKFRRVSSQYHYILEE